MRTRRSPSRRLLRITACLSTVLIVGCGNQQAVDTTPPATSPTTTAATSTSTTRPPLHTTTTARVEATLDELSTRLTKASEAAAAAQTMSMEGVAEHRSEQSRFRVKASATVGEGGDLHLASVVIGEGCEDHTIVVIKDGTAYTWDGQKWETSVAGETTDGTANSSPEDLLSAVIEPLRGLGEDVQVAHEGDTWMVQAWDGNGMHRYSYRFKGQHLAEADLTYVSEADLTSVSEADLTSVSESGRIGVSDPDGAGTPEGGGTAVSTHSYRFSGWGEAHDVKIPDTTKPPTEKPSCLAGNVEP